MQESANPVVDKTVIKCLGFCGGGFGSNICAVDVKDDKIVRIRPLHYDTQYTPEELNAWKLEANGVEFEPGFKSYIPPLTLAYKTRTYSKNRVPYPLKRVDWDPHGDRNPQNRGKSKYVRISWDEACTIIAEEIDRVYKTYGSRSIFVAGDGHGETKSYHGGHGAMTRLFENVGDGDYCYQSRNADSWEGWYWGAKFIWGMEPVGQNTNQENMAIDIANHSDAILWWGADPETTPWGWGGQMSSRMMYWWSEVGVKQIWIAPDVNYSNCIHADKWIPILPNTDAALQCAIAYVWMTEGMVYKDYLDTHAVGYDWFEYYILGHEDGVPKTPEWASEKCGVPVYTIKALARYWGTHTVSIGHCNGGGYIRAAFAHEPGRLEVALLGMQGLGRHGANFFRMMGWTIFGLRTMSALPPSEVYLSTRGSHNGAGMGGVPPSGAFIPKTLVPQGLEVEADDPLKWYGHTTAGSPWQDELLPFQYPVEGNPGVRMIWSDAPCWETCWNGGFRLQDSMLTDRMECVIVQHPWMENETVMADIILPVSTTLELTDLENDTENAQWSALVYAEAAVTDIFDSKSDWEAVLAVAEKLEELGGMWEGLMEKLTHGQTMDERLKIGFEQSGLNDADLTWEQFKDQQFWLSKTADDWRERPAGMIKFYEDPEGNPLTTPTGKLEYYSSVLATAFPDDTERGPVPHWVDETEEHQDRLWSDRAKDYPFLLVSNHPRWRVHAQHDDMPWTREIETCKVTGPDGYAYEPVWINPADAEKLGVKNGDVVKLFNERGTVLGGVRVTQRIMPNVVYQDHGARVDTLEYGTGGMERAGANNMIAPKGTTSKNCAGEVTSGFLVGVEKIDPAELAAKYPDTYNKPFDPATGTLSTAYYIIEEE